jgi:type I restriction enzyme S subunit
MVMMAETPPQLPQGHELDEQGMLPNDWRIAPLSAIAAVSRRAPARVGRGLIPFVPMALIPEDSLHLTSWELRSPDEIRSGVVFYEGDLLFAKITPCLENGKQGIAKGHTWRLGLRHYRSFPFGSVSPTATRRCC